MKWSTSVEVELIEFIERENWKQDSLRLTAKQTEIDEKVLAVIFFQWTIGLNFDWIGLENGLKVKTPRNKLTNKKRYKNETLEPSAITMYFELHCVCFCMGISLNEHQPSVPKKRQRGKENDREREREQHYKFQMNN